MKRITLIIATLLGFTFTLNTTACDRYDCRALNNFTVQICSPER